MFLRLNNDSSIKMISPGLANTEVAVDRGRAMMEVDQVDKTNALRVAVDAVTTRLLKTGLYEFDAQQNRVRVFKGQAAVQKGNCSVKVKGGQELSLNNAKLKTTKFPKKAYEGDLYRFSRRRSHYLSEANALAAQVYRANGWRIGPGWWWDPWFGTYTFVPVNGNSYSPFDDTFYGGPFHQPDWGWVGGLPPQEVPIYVGSSYP